MILKSASRHQPQTSFSTREPWRICSRSQMNELQGTRWLRSGSARSCSQADALFCPSSDKGGGVGGWVEWGGGLHHQRQDAARSQIRDFFFIEEKKRKEKRKKILLCTVDTQHGLLRLKRSLQIFCRMSDSEFTHIDFNDGINY